MDEASVNEQSCEGLLLDVNLYWFGDYVYCSWFFKLFRTHLLDLMLNHLSFPYCIQVNGEELLEQCRHEEKQIQQLLSGLHIYPHQSGSMVVSNGTTYAFLPSSPTPWLQKIFMSRESDAQVLYFLFASDSFGVVGAKLVIAAVLVFHSFSF